MTPAKMTAFLRQYEGCPYTWWHMGDPIGAAAPFYEREAGSAPPTVAEAARDGINCAGLINVGRLACGLAGIDGTYGYGTAFTWHPLGPTPPPAGAVLFRAYCDDADQGHVAYMMDEKSIIHAVDWESETGVVCSSYEDWRGYMTHWAPFEAVFLE